MLHHQTSTRLRVRGLRRCDVCDIYHLLVLFVTSLDVLKVSPARVGRALPTNKLLPASTALLLMFYQKITIQNFGQFRFRLRTYKSSEAKTELQLSKGAKKDQYVKRSDWQCQQNCFNNQ